MENNEDVKIEEESAEQLTDSMNNILKSKIQEVKEEENTDEVKRVIGNYKRVYFFEDFVANLSKQSIGAINALISNKDRSEFYNEIKDFKSQLDYYKYFDLKWQKRLDEYVKKDKSMNKSIEENLTLINSSVTIGLKYFLELISIKGYLNKNIDQNTFNAYKNETFNKITEKYTSTSAEELRLLKQEYEMDMAKICCLADEYYNEFISKLEII